MRNKKGIAPIAVVGIVILSIIAIYFILFILQWLNIPPIKELFATINFYILIVIWILFQFVIVYGAYKIISYVVRGFSHYKQLFQQNLLKVERWIIK